LPICVLSIFMPVFDFPILSCLRDRLINCRLINLMFTKRIERLIVLTKLIAGWSLAPAVLYQVDRG